LNSTQSGATGAYLIITCLCETMLIQQLLILEKEAKPTTVNMLVISSIISFLWILISSFVIVVGGQKLRNSCRAEQTMK